MTTARRTILILSMMLAGFCQMLAYDFSEGMLNYKILGEDCVEVCGSIANINSITIPATVRGGMYRVTSIGNSAFSYSDFLTSVTISEGVTNIGSSAFSYCKALTSVTIPESMSTIGNNAFFNCKKLTSVVIPDGVESLGEMCFYECDALQSAVVGQGVTSIQKQTFYGCESLRSVSLGAKMTSIGDRAFYACDALTAISIPTGVTTLGEQAFFMCNSLTEVILPDGVESIGKQAFMDCAVLTAVTIPESVVNWGWRVFWECPQLADVVNLSTAPQVVDSETFSTYGTLHVKKGLADVYKASEVWKNFTIADDIAPDIVFNDGDPYAIKATREYDNVTYSRSFDDTEWQALYLPFALHYEEWSDDYDIARINNVIEYDDDDDGTFDRTYLVILKKTSGSTTPNHPYLIRAKSQGTHTLHLTNKTFAPSANNSFFCCSMDDTYTFTGSYSTVTDMYAKGYYALADGRLQRAADASVTLNPQRWYLAITPRNEADTPAAVRMQSIGILVDGEDNLEGIDSLTPNPSPTGRGGQNAYDLMGRVVSTATYIQGVTIVNGRKIIR